MHYFKYYQGPDRLITIYDYVKTSLTYTWSAESSRFIKKDVAIVAISVTTASCNIWYLIMTAFSRWGCNISTCTSILHITPSLTINTLKLKIYIDHHIAIVRNRHMELSSKNYITDLEGWQQRKIAIEQKTPLKAGIALWFPYTNATWQHVGTLRQ